MGFTILTVFTLVIPALCKAMNMTLIILQQNADNQWIEIQHTPQHSESSSERYVGHLLHVQLPNGTQHYDALVQYTLLIKVIIHLENGRISYKVTSQNISRNADQLVCHQQSAQHCHMTCCCFTVVI